MPERDFRYSRPRLKALGQDSGLLLRRPAPSPGLSGNQLDPPTRAPLMTVIKTGICHRDISTPSSAESFASPPASPQVKSSHRLRLSRSRRTRLSPHRQGWTGRVRLRDRLRWGRWDIQRCVSRTPGWWLDRNRAILQQRRWRQSHRAPHETSSTAC